MYNCCIMGMSVCVWGGQRENVEMHACIMVVLCECRRVFGGREREDVEMHECIIVVLCECRCVCGRGKEGGC